MTYGVIGPMKRGVIGPMKRGVIGFLALGILAGPAAAQSVGYVTGFPGKDPAGDDAIGWGPAYRPETSFSQPGTPPTPGDFAGAAHRRRTGHGVYDRVEGRSPRVPRLSDRSRW